MDYGPEYDDHDEPTPRTQVEEIGSGHGPEAAARAQAARQRSESTTPAGIAEQAVRLHRELLDEARTDAREIRKEAREHARALIDSAQKQADKILEDARAAAEHQRSEQRAIAVTTGELVAVHLRTQKDLAGWYEQMRAPLARSPTTGENVVELGKHLLDKARDMFGDVAKGNPKLLTAAFASRFGIPEQVLSEAFAAPVTPAAGAPPAGAPPPGAPPPAAPVPADDGFWALRVNELLEVFDELGPEYQAAFSGRTGARNLGEITLGQWREVFVDLQKQRAAGGGSTPPTGSDAAA